MVEYHDTKNKLSAIMQTWHDFRNIVFANLLNYIMLE
jgi:homoserine trans-succinylase